MTAHSSLRRLTLVVLPAFFAAPLHAQSNNLGGVVALSSQLVDRGLAITPVTPILQGNVTWNSASGWILGISAATETRSPGHGSEAMVQAAHYWSLSADWRMQAGAVYYDYPGNPQSRPFDRIETGLNWMYRDVLSFGVSAITLTRGDDHHPRGAADVDFHWPLPAHFALSAGLGVTQSLYRQSQPAAPWNDGGYGGGYTYGYGYHLARTSSYYGYGHLGLIWAYGPWQVELDRIATDPSIRRQGGMAAAPWVATVSWSF